MRDHVPSLPVSSHYHYDVDLSIIRCVAHASPKREREHKILKENDVAGNDFFGAIFQIRPHRLSSDWPWHDLCETRATSRPTDDAEHAAVDVTV